jgi:hypothetical protein
MYTYNGITFEITGKRQEKRCPWGFNWGNAYKITVKNKNNDVKITFDFWDSMMNLRNDLDLLYAFQSFAGDAVDGFQFDSAEQVALNYGYDNASNCTKTFHIMKNSAKKFLKLGLTADDAIGIENDIQ